MRTYLLVFAAMAIAALAAFANVGDAPEAPVGADADVGVRVATESVPVSETEKPRPLETCPERLPNAYADDDRAKRSVIVVFKSLYLLGKYENGTLAEDGGKPICFPIAMGSKPWKAKVSMDYASTPEGWYRATSKQGPESTEFHRAIRVGYPNADDIERAFGANVIDEQTKDRMLADVRAGRLPSQNSAMGGDIMIHGMGIDGPDWTAGCVALKNSMMDVLFRHVRTGDPILITPWTERYAMAPDGSVVVSTVPKPDQGKKEIVIPIDASRYDWKPGARFARVFWDGSGYATVEPILASP